MKNLLLSALLLVPAQSLLAAPVTYIIDPGHTTVLWEAKHFGTSTNHGRFDKESGKVVLDRENKTGKIEIEIDLGSNSTGTANFDKHLAGEDFFNVAKNPTASFVADQLSFDGDKLKAVTGKLSMLGKEGEVTLTATAFNCYDNPYSKKQVCGGDFETTIKRSLWGMEYGLPGIPDEVRLRIQVEAAAE